MSEIHYSTYNSQEEPDAMLISHGQERFIFINRWGHLEVSVWVTGEVTMRVIGTLVATTGCASIENMRLSYRDWCAVNQEIKDRLLVFGLDMDKTCDCDTNEMCDECLTPEFRLMKERNDRRCDLITKQVGETEAQAGLTEVEQLELDFLEKWCSLLKPEVTYKLEEEEWDDVEDDVG